MVMPEVKHKGAVKLNASSGTRKEEQALDLQGRVMSQVVSCLLSDRFSMRLQASNMQKGGGTAERLCLSLPLPSISRR
jgi:hypothetical protein